MRLRPLAGTVSLLFGLVTFAAHDAKACAGCRNPSVATSRGSEGPLAAGALRAGATLTGTTVHVVHQAGCADPALCEELPAQPLHLHDQHLYPFELRLVAEYGLDETFGVEAQLPVRLIHTTVEYTTPSGAPYEPLDEGNHHRNETLVGAGDPWLLLRIGASIDNVWLAARPGVSLPVGKTEEDPFELGEQGRRHQHIQFGSGTFDPVLVLEATAQLDPVELQFFAQGQASLYENSHGYRAPWRVHGGVSAGSVLVGDASGALGVEVLHEDAERWGGTIAQDGNLGRTELLLALSLAQSIGATELSLALRAPIWRDIVTGDEPEGELSSPLIVSLGVAHVFGG